MVESVIVLAVLFGTVLVGALAVGTLTLRVARRARVLAEEVTRVSGEYQASSADLRERVDWSGAGT